MPKIYDLPGDSLRGQAQKNAAGGVLMETALLLPLFLACIFYLLWVSAAMHGRTALTTAMTSAVRLAATRGDVNRVGSPPIAIDFSNPSFQSLLKSPDQSWSDAEQFYNLWSNNIFGRPFDELPQSWIYTIIYINEAMRVGVGPSVRYPCDPQGDLNKGDDGADCLKCEILNPETFSKESGKYGFADLEIMGRIAVNCEYQPVHGVLKSFLSLLDIILGPENNRAKIVVKRKTFFDIYDVEWGGDVE